MPIMTCLYWAVDELMSGKKKKKNQCPHSASSALNKATEQIIWRSLKPQVTGTRMRNSWVGALSQFLGSYVHKLSLSALRR